MADISGRYPPTEFSQKYAAVLAPKGKLVSPSDVFGENGVFGDDVEEKTRQAFRVTMKKLDKLNSKSELHKEDLVREKIDQVSFFKNIISSHYRKNFLSIFTNTIFVGIFCQFFFKLFFLIIRLLNVFRIPCPKNYRIWFRNQNGQNLLKKLKLGNNGGACIKKLPNLWEKPQK